MCRRPFGALLLLAAIAVVAAPTGEAQAQKKNKAGANAGGPIDSAKLAAGEYVGILRGTPGTDRLFTIEVENRQVVPTGKAKVVGRTITAGTKVKITPQEIEFQASRKAKVRTMVLPEQFDDKGNPKKYTAKQLAELKGKDKHLVGYESSLEKLEPGQVVRVVLGAAPSRPAAKNKDKDTPDEEATVEKKMQASLVVVLKEANASTAGAPPRKKKN